MKNTQVQVYLGHPQTDPAEQRALGRLRRDLEQCGIPARIVANVFVGPQGRQLDFIIVLPERVVMCELKSYRNPVISRPNGDWHQMLPDGSRGSLLGNPFGQATDATYALADALRRFVSAGGRSDLASRYFPQDIDTVICMFPAAPEGSTIPKRFRHVNVVSYHGLLQRLANPGPRPPLSDADWEAFIAALGAEPPVEDEAERRLRDARTALQEYRAALVDGLQAELAPRVPTGVLVDGVASEDPDIAALLQAGEALTLIGPPGVGKTHLARHVALACARDDMLVLWLEAGTFGDDLDAALAEATSPVSTRPPSELMELAVTAGWPTVLVLDALNECPEHPRRRLLAQLSALRRQSGTSLLLSAQASPTLPEALTGPALEVMLPADEQKATILDAYGARQLDRYVEMFSTPFELSVAAACAEEVPALSSRVQLLDAYVHRLAPHEPVRAALRSLAWALHVALRSSLPLGEVRMALLGDGVAPETLDETLGTRLIRVRHGRVAFRHELLARVLAAEQLLVQSAGAGGLASVLSEPRHRPLRADAVAMLTDPEQSRHTLAAIADPDLLLEAVDGELGDTARVVVCARLETLLEHATEVTTFDHARMELLGPLSRWIMASPWSPVERAGFVAVGRALRRGHFVERLIALLNCTDALARVQARALQEAGDPTPIATAFAATYESLSPAGDSGLAAAHILDACRMSEFMPRSAVSCPGGISARLLAAAEPQSWGVLYGAVLLLNSDESEDVALLPDLFQKTWKAGGGYHLRLEALQRAERSARMLQGEPRRRMEEVLRGLEVEDVGSSTMLVEALAAFEMLPPQGSVDAIHTEISAILASEDPQQAGLIAHGIVSSQWEDQRIVGPYAEAIETLDPKQRVGLLLLALEATHTDDLSADWIIEQLDSESLRDDPTVRTALMRFARAADPRTWHSVQWGVCGHLAVLRACAHLGDQPPLLADEEHPTGAWATLSELLFWVLRERAGHDARERVETLWALLTSRDRAAAGSLLYELHHAHIVVAEGEPRTHDTLVAAYPEQVRRIATWSLEHRHELDSPFNHPDRAAYVGHMVRLLGEVGDTASAALLRRQVDEPDLSDAAREAVRAIELRETETPGA